LGALGWQLVAASPEAGTTNVTTSIFKRASYGGHMSPAPLVGMDCFSKALQLFVLYLANNNKPKRKGERGKMLDVISGLRVFAVLIKCNKKTIEELLALKVESGLSR
jgi:hypothetical protein